MSQEKLQTKIMQIFFLGGGRGVVKEVYYGICASREYVFDIGDHPTAVTCLLIAAECFR